MLRLADKEETKACRSYIVTKLMTDAKEKENIMHNLVVKPFTKMDQFIEKLTNLKNGHPSFVSYQLGTPKHRNTEDAISVSLIGYHEHDEYVILISVGWYLGDEIFTIVAHIPDLGYTKHLSTIAQYLLDNYATKEYLDPKITETLSNKQTSQTIRFEDILKRTMLPKAEAISVFTPESHEYKRLEAAAALIQSETNVKCKVENCMFDMGQNWMYTTILCESDMTTFPWVQMLNPKQQKLIVFGSLEQFQTTVLELIHKKQ